jgi:hypothetical protein
MVQMIKQLYYTTDKLFNEYFHNLTFYKTKDNGLYSLYHSRILSQTMSGHKYVIITVQLDNNVNGTQKNIKELDWVSIQTRELKEEYIMKSCKLMPSKDVINIFNHIFLNKLNTNNHLTSYSLENNQYPIEGAIIHNKGCEVYPDRLTLDSAIRSFKFLLMKLEWVD